MTAHPERPERPESAAAVERPRAPKGRLGPRMASVLGLLVLSPVAAEYLIGYDDSVGALLALLGGLLILGPLYGGAAVLIREAARRTGRGLPTMLLLGTAFGVIQAGLVDQSMFNDAYRDIDYWDDARLPTLVPMLGVSVHQALGFVTGHAVWSICAPIVVIESLAPRRAAVPWLRTPGLVVVAVLYLLASAVISSDHYDTEGAVASAPQLAGAAAVAAALVAAAFAVGRRPGRAGGRWTPHPLLVGGTALVLLGAFQFTPPNWAGAVGAIALLGALAGLMALWSRGAAWGPMHRFAVFGGALLVNALIAFLVVPLEGPTPAAKLAHNSVLLLCVAGLLAAAAVAIRRADRGRGNTPAGG
ncbi:hypothetical protein CLV63_13818 [Murinocardiopsis flavida]|uniref:Uncharacterized protein n=1 Tax=Murinocardiopsis flavida TaxID=645275 RepID=A0A2P8CJ84_9ACTN|nr:hypothetical protein [Murinocardiopsis flavida]PSK85019.1 hypothetical protein CLV63_13818 [Murinocardiopsis flavida]